MSCEQTTMATVKAYFVTTDGDDEGVVIAENYAEAVQKVVRYYGITEDEILAVRLSDGDAIQ